MKPLFFRHQRGAYVSQREGVRYEIRYSQWYDGNRVDPFYVEIFDMKRGEIISTEATHRFKNYDDAKDFLGDVYQGKIRTDILKSEEDSTREAERARYDSMIAADVDRFKHTLNLHGILLDDFVSRMAARFHLHDDAQAAVYREAEGEQE